ncbi:MAG: hypothetical protein PVI91_00855 [Gammaproteobacteria bacterium]|jgi:hypothetical protein
MSKTVQQKMHEQHLQWDRDTQTWRSDIEQWKSELQAAVRDLDTIAEAMRDSLLALENHGDTVWEHVQRLKAHELVVDEEAKEGANRTDREWATRHEAESSRHDRLSDAHERIKRHQHGMVAEVKRLLERMMEAV